MKNHKPDPQVNGWGCIIAHTLLVIIVLLPCILTIVFKNAWLLTIYAGYFITLYIMHKAIRRELTRLKKLAELLNPFQRN